MTWDRLRRFALGLTPLALAFTALAVLAWGRPGSAQDPAPAPTPGPASRCVAGFEKSVKPSFLILGDTAQVTMVMTHTCPADIKPIDLIFLADVSNSMTRGRNLPRPGETPGPDPTEVPPEPPFDDAAGDEAEGMALAAALPRVDPLQALFGDQEPGPGPGPGDPGPGLGGSEPPGCEVPRGGDPPVPGTPGPDPTEVPPEPPFGLALAGEGALSGPDQGPGPGPGPGPGIETPTPRGGQPDEPPGTEDLIREVQTTIRDILDRPEIQRDLANGKLRVGLASFNDRGNKLIDLTNQAQKVRSRVGSLRGGGHSRIDLGLRTAQTMFVQRDANGRIVQDDDRVKILVIMSDGLFCSRDFRNAGRTSNDFKVVTMAAGRSADLRKLRQLASELPYALRLNDLRELMHLYDQVLPASQPVMIPAASIRDELQANMELIPGSVDPPTVTVTGQLLEWQFAPLPAAVTMTYQVRPLEAGILPVSVASGATWTDSEALPGAGQFPMVDIEVLAPTPTPTNTSTPTDTPTPTATYTPTPLPTSTPTPGPRYMPFLVRNWPEATPCVPEDQVVDIALVIDTSNSMSDPTQAGGISKIDAAIQAGKGMVDMLLPAGRPTQAQVTVIWFNAQAQASIPLSGDRDAVNAALDSLKSTQAGGTRIDLGLREGNARLGASTRPTAKQSMILVTDGGQADQQWVLTEADAVKARGVELFTIGLGQDADSALLIQVASSPRHYTHAPNAEDLEAIYREIGAVLPCP